MFSFPADKPAEIFGMFHFGHTIPEGGRKLLTWRTDAIAFW